MELGCVRMGALAGLTALVLSPGEVDANLRAPLRVVESPSSALYTPGGAVEVVAEALAFRCDANACRVEATYDLRAAEAAAVTLTFISPVAGPVAVELLAPGGEAVSILAQAHLAESLDAREQAIMEGGAWRDVPVYRASFDAPLPAGPSQIAVSYQQELTLEERGHSYFSDGDLLYLVEYHLWPIKEWRADPELAVELEISIPREAPGMWARLWRSFASIGCAALDGDPSISSRRVQVGDRLEYHATVPKERLPDVLRCVIGPAEWAER